VANLLTGGGFVGPAGPTDQTTPGTWGTRDPTGNLDATTGRQIADLMFDLRDRFGTTLVLVTHESELLERGDRQILIESGRLVED
jgi:putative ABC transport system ATP-binding protein